MKRLYLQIYLTIIAILLIVIVTMGVVGRLAFDETRFDAMMTAVGELATNALPPPTAPRARQQEMIDRVHDLLRIDLALYAADGTLVAHAGRPLPPSSFERPEPRWRGRGTWRVPLNDGRVIVTSIPHGPWQPGPPLAAALIGIALAVAIGAWPLTRRLTRRLERLKAGVDQLGGGNLAARVKIEGRDEVAALAESFNRSAARIEELMRSHKMLLANASHELRTPLTRINMALAMAEGAPDARQREQLKADVAELDQLVEEILLASRLDAVKTVARSEDIDLLALAAEEAARDGIAVEGAPVFVHGERALLRRMIRNLIDNARRHGSDAAPDIKVGEVGGRAIVEVGDRGAGVPDGERERIFEPFYRLAGSAESGRGSGLGLALVRQITRYHGGDVQCRARAGGGTLFSIALPSIHMATQGA